MSDDFSPGLEGVIAFETEIAEPDKDGGALRYRGVDIEELAGHVTFGSFNTLQKINDPLIALWARVLAATPGSRRTLPTSTPAYLLKNELSPAADRPYVFHLGAQAHVGESWHRPYETVQANTIGTLNLLQSIVDNGIELERFDTAGTSEEYGNVREAVAMSCESAS